VRVFGVSVAPVEPFASVALVASGGVVVAELSITGAEVDASIVGVVDAPTIGELVESTATGDEDVAST